MCLDSMSTTIPLLTLPPALGGMKRFTSTAMHPEEFWLPFRIIHSAATCSGQLRLSVPTSPSPVTVSSPIWCQLLMVLQRLALMKASAFAMLALADQLTKLELPLPTIRSKDQVLVMDFCKVCGLGLPGNQCPVLPLPATRFPGIRPAC